MQQFHLSRVGYVMLGVADIKTSVKFYKEKLGLKVTSESGELVFIDAGSISLVLSTEVGRKAGDSEVVFTVEHVRTAYEALTGLGISFAGKPHQVSGASWAASFHDPDGHVLSLFGPE